MAHQYMPKIFHEPQQKFSDPPPTYLKYRPLLLNLKKAGKTVSSKKKIKKNFKAKKKETKLVSEVEAFL